MTHTLSDAEVADFCASFQRVVVETLVDRTFDVARRLGARSVGIAGGVSANSRLRRDATARGEAEGVPVFIPSIALSTDNAAMIAAAGLRLLERGHRSPLDFNADPALALGASYTSPHHHIAPSPITTSIMVHTDYLWFETREHQEFIRITDQVARV